VLRTVLDHAIQLRGQVVYVNGEQVGRIEMAVPADVPFGFIAIPQLPVIRDTAGAFARRYDVDGPAAFVVRPDGYLGFASREAAGSVALTLVAHLRDTFG
jgi:hypothetical protein